MQGPTLFYNKSVLSKCQGITGEIEYRFPVRERNLYIPANNENGFAANHPSGNF
jgi:hypothetical protein